MKIGRVAEYLESADVAKILGVTPTRVRQMECEGKIPASARTRAGGRLFTAEVAEEVRLSRLAASGKPRSRT
jgi:DNA-binding transcriptional MerR regulator